MSIRGLWGSLLQAGLILSLPRWIQAKGKIRLSSTEWNELYEASRMAEISYFPWILSDYDEQKERYNLEFLEAWEKTPDQAMVAKVKGVHACYGAFRGTDDFDPTFEDWIQNFSLDDHEVNGCTVRKGFYDGYNTAYRAKFEAAMERCMAKCSGKRVCYRKRGRRYCRRQKCKMIFTGHSQGGSIAAVAGLVYKDKNPLVATFGAPKAVYETCSALEPTRHYRFINAHNLEAGSLYDLAPNLFGNGAEHFGRAIVMGSQNQLAPAYIGLNNRQQRYGNCAVTCHLIRHYEERMRKVRDYNKRRRRKYIYITGWKNGSLCGYDDECESGRCAGLVPPYRCQAKAKLLEQCYGDSDCESGKCVFVSNRNLKICAQKDGKIPNGGPCMVDRDCSTGRCEGYLERTCKRKVGVKSSCNENSDCQSDVCLQSVMKCAQEDGKMPNGGPCRDGSQCSSGRCEGFSYPGTCEGRLKKGRRCNEDSDCLSNDCNWYFKCD
ncbi:expressed unknown protein [Seminavis robusta]|uniref:Fungal lipase-type domain-containing protein n=1 Tax=Seminavis robusta TaxID=568900 RepID=A0A9N8EL29_9STRA|nr:expressed unknown protein [Seminavis robusta]|eukprot:Sro1105_g241890.1 n/a (492) ;mRNA; r:6466-8160